MRDKLIFLGIGGFVLGTFVQSYFALDFYFILFLVLVGCAVLIYRKIATPSFGILFLAILFLAFAAGAARYEISNIRSGDNILDKLDGQYVEIVGIISDEPDKRENNVHYVVNLKELDQKGKSVRLDSRALIISGFFPTYKYGDEIKITGKIERPKNFQSENGREFDYESFLAKEGIYYEFFQPAVTLIAHDKGNTIKKWLFELKQSFTSNVNRIIPEPEASLLSGLIVGAKQSLGKDRLDDFRRAGVIHIVVLSGYNITIVAEAIMKFFSFMPKHFGTGFGALGIILFAIMTGASATVVRASIMALLVILARVIHRDYDIKRALFLAGFFMVLQNPKILAFDPSFQLSFMATLGLIYVAPLLTKYFRFVPEKFGFREVVCSTVSTQIFVTPLLLFMMGQVSIVALPVNILILVFIPATMYFGFLAGIISFISSMMAVPFAYIAYGLLWYEIKIVEVFSSLPLAAVNIAYFPAFLMAITYGIYGYLLLRLNKYQTYKNA